jgi:predicted GNAT family acetyltransferase
MIIKVLKNDEIKEYDGLGDAITDMSGRYSFYAANRVWFVIFNEEGQWMGFGGYRKIDDTKCFLGPTMVKPEFRGKGLQGQLISIRLDKAKEDGYKEAYSYFSTLNITNGYKSGNNLLKAGFKLCRIPHYGEYEVDEVWVKKELSTIA